LFAQLFSWGIGASNRVDLYHLFTHPHAISQKLRLDEAWASPLWNVILSLLDDDPEKRPSLEEVETALETLNRPSQPVADQAAIHWLETSEPLALDGRRLYSRIKWVIDSIKNDARLDEFKRLWSDVIAIPADSLGEGGLQRIWQQLKEGISQYLEASLEFKPEAEPVSFCQKRGREEDSEDRLSKKVKEEKMEKEKAPTPFVGGLHINISVISASFFERRSYSISAMEQQDDLLLDVSAVAEI
jgi:hypothetical protein